MSKTPMLGNIRVFTGQGTMAQWPTAEVSVTTPGYKMIGGGARVNWTGQGNLLTASYPKASNIWAASGKDHGGSGSPATLDVWAIAIYDPQDEFDVVIDWSDSTAVPHPEASVPARDGYQLVGGGAKAHWTTHGQLLTASYPVGTGAWFAKSKDHGGGFEEPNFLTVYAISMKPRNGSALIPIRISPTTVSVNPHPEGACIVPEGCNLIGGGAQVNWTGYGNLLTASYPNPNFDAWVAQSKDHGEPDPSSLTIYAIGIDKKYFS